MSPQPHVQQPSITETQTTPLLKVRSLTKCYGEGENKVTALDGVDLDLYPGRIYGLLGPNGAGKTTLMRICATLLQPTSGSVEVAGFDTVREAPSVRAHLGYLSASTDIYERLTPTELLRYFGRLHDMSSERIEERTRQLFAQLAIASFRDRPAGKLSTGMRQKVSIARAFLHDPPVLILDEPTNGLDLVVRQSLLDLLRNAVCPDRLIILSTHDLPEAEELCDAFIFIDGGRLVIEGNKDDLLHEGDNLRSVFFRALEGREEPTFAP